MRRTSAEPVLDAVAAALMLQVVVDEQRRQGEQLTKILHLLERGRGTRDAADLALVVAIDASIGAAPFTAAQLLAHAETHEGLRDALDGCDLTSPREVGCLCRRLEGTDVAGLRLARVDITRTGVVWQLRVCET